MNAGFQLLLFSTDPEFIRKAIDAGVAGIIVDWERSGKESRQRGFDTQIGTDTEEDLQQVRRCTKELLICRINGYGPTTRKEVEQAIAAGADEILLPMVRTLEEVARLLEQVRGRCGVGILVETEAAVALVEDLAKLPLSRIYVGLNDLAIERKTPNIFAALIDCTVEKVRRAFRVLFGFGGLTLPELGSPIPCHLLMGEMVRLGCRFSFLRRSFHHDIRGRDLTVEIPRILAALQEMGQRDAVAMNADRRALLAAVQAWDGHRRT